MKSLIAALIAAIYLSGCSINPPNPPKCDGSDRRPVNEVRKTTAAVAVADKCSRG